MSNLLCVVDGDIILSKISETTKIRVMVLPIIAMLAVTMIVAGYQQDEEQADIDVDEGFAEMELEYLDYGSNIPVDPDGVVANATAVAEIIDYNGELELYAEVDTLAAAGEKHNFYVSIIAEGAIDENLSPEKFLFTCRNLPVHENFTRNTVHFLNGFTDIEGGSPWSSTEQTTGASGNNTAHLGFDLERNQFKAESRFVWQTPFGNEESFTIELEGIVLGLSEEVRATIEINITPPEGGVE